MYFNEMRIKRFNEMNLSEDSKDLVESLDGACGYGIIEWIAEMSKYSNIEEIKKYGGIEGITNSDPKDEKFIREKNLTQTIEYLTQGKKYFKLKEELEILGNLIENLYLNSAYELLYHFQEDLIHHDFNLLLELFEDEEDKILPELKEKYKDIIETSRESSKFNM